MFVVNERSKQKCDLRREAQSFQPVPKGLERIYPRDTTDWPEPQYKPGVQLNHQLALHTAAAAKLTEPTAIGQTVTPYGGAVRAFATPPLPPLPQAPHSLPLLHLRHLCALGVCVVLLCCARGVAS